MKRAIAIIMCCLWALNLSLPAFALYKDENIFYCQKNDQQKIALTFDDGPHPRHTRKILDVLKKYDVKATFFVIGQNIEYYPGIVEQILSEGHEIGNHTYRHKRTKTMNNADFSEDVRHCDGMIADNCNYKTKLFRPPEGYVDEKVKAVARELGYSIILWNIDTRDWEHASAHQIADGVTEKATAGDIILMHDYVSGKSSTVEALEMIIPRLLSRGYRFVRVSELIEGEAS